MNFSEAITDIENELSELKMKDVFGRECVGMESLAVVAKFHGPVWDQIEDDFCSGRLTVEEYRDCAILLIKEYSRNRFRGRIEKQLSELRQAV